MNTRKSIFAILSCLTIMAATAAPYVVDDEESGVKRKHTQRVKKNKNK